MLDYAVTNGTTSSGPSESISFGNVPVDALLPQLADILDAESMKAQLQEYLFASTGERERFLIKLCEIAQVRYKPEASCMVSYRLEIADTETGARKEQILCGRAYPVGRSQSHREKAEARTLVQPRFGKPLIYLPEVEMVLWSFPNDRKMRTLPAAIDPACSTPELLTERLAAHLGAGWHVINATPRLIHYVGEHTCTVRTSVELLRRSTNEHQSLTIFGKTYYDGEGAETDRVMRQLWDSEARRSGRLSVAQPLWYDPDIKTLWQLGVPGTTLENCALESQECSLLLMEAARAVAALHATPLWPLRSVTMSDLITKLKSVSAMLIRCRPSCQPVLVPLVNRLLAQADMIPPHPPATLHGDLHMKNFLADSGRVTLIDLDNVCAGSPYHDLGSLVAALHYAGLLRSAPDGLVSGTVETLLESYAGCAPWPVPREVVDWHTAVALITERAYRSVTRLKNGRFALVDQLIALAGDISRTSTIDRGA